MHAPPLVARSLAALLALGVACSSGDGTKPTPTPAGVAAVAGTLPQTAVAGTVVPTPPAVRVVDVDGNSMAGVAVTFSVGAGGGTVEGGTATTNANGIASVSKWTLGPTAGANTL